MAKFKPGDIVKVTSTHDRGWRYWYESNNRFINKVAKISNISTDPQNPKIIMIELKACVKNENGDEFTVSAWFADHHVILVNYDEKLEYYKKETNDELQRWEKKKRDMTNKALASVFDPNHESKALEKEHMKKDEYFLSGEHDIPLADIDEDIEGLNNIFDDITEEFLLDLD